MKEISRNITDCINIGLPVYSPIIKIKTKYWYKKMHMYSIRKNSS